MVLMSAQHESVLGHEELRQRRLCVFSHCGEKPIPHRLETRHLLTRASSGMDHRGFAKSSIVTLTSPSFVQVRYCLIHASVPLRTD